MEITYTTRMTGYEPGKRYANARYFTGTKRGVSRVVLDGSFPRIREAYEQAGVPVVSAAEAQAIPAPNAVEIPDDWQSLPWSRPADPGGLTLRSLVKALGKQAVNRAEALEVIGDYAGGR